MSGYAWDPYMQLPAKWEDKNGTFRLLMRKPVEGYVMARRTGAAPFIVSVRDLLSGGYEPVVKAKGET